MNAWNTCPDCGAALTWDHDPNGDSFVKCACGFDDSTLGHGAHPDNPYISATNPPWVWEPNA